MPPPMIRVTRGLIRRWPRLIAPEVRLRQGGRRLASGIARDFGRPSNGLAQDDPDFVLDGAAVAGGAQAETRP